jgi:hypothetical protein
MRIFLLALGLVPVVALGAPKKHWTVEAETGPVWFGRNSVASPGSSGTRFPFSQLTGKGAFPNFRATLTWEGDNGPGWRAMYAPLRVNRTGALDQATTFEGTTFAAGVPTQGVYQFNSYRLTYRNRWKKSDRSDWRVGFTLKARDAEIRLAQGATAAKTKNFGLVPLLHVYGEEKLSDRWTFVVDFDGAAAPQGRALDLGLKLAYQLNAHLGFSLGLRTLEGGVDNKKNTNLVRFDYVTLGIRYRF